MARFSSVVPTKILYRLHRCRWRMMETKCVGDNWRKLVTWSLSSSAFSPVRVENFEKRIFDHLICLFCGKVWVNRIDAMRTFPADSICIKLNSFNVKPPVFSAEFENSEKMRILVQLLSVIGAIRPRENQSGAKLLQNEIDFANSITPMIDPNCPWVLDLNKNIPEHT